MSPFERVCQSVFHRVAVGPHELPTPSVFGSDIVLHLPVLEYYASLCRHVTEFGVRDGYSTIALLSGCRGEVHSYDLVDPPARPLLSAIELPCSWVLHLGDTGSPDLVVGETDFLFVDTLHTYAHVTQELAHHGRKARRYLGFHDTFTCGMVDRSGPDPNARGILPAIHEFLARYPGEYRTVFHTDRCNGLWVLERV
jgi:hypothetical protein